MDREENKRRCHYLRISQKFDYNDFEHFDTETSELHYYSSKEHESAKLCFNENRTDPPSYYLSLESKLQLIDTIIKSLESLTISKACQKQLYTLMYLLNAKYIEGEQRNVRIVTSQIASVVGLLIRKNAFPLLLSLFYKSIEQQSVSSSSQATGDGQSTAASISSLSSFCILQILIALKTLPSPEYNDHDVELIRSYLCSTTGVPPTKCLSFLATTLVNYTKKLLPELPVMRVMILLRIVILYVCGGLGQSEKNKRKARLLHGLSNEVYQETDEIKNALHNQDVIIRPKIPKIRAQELENILRSMYDRHFGYEISTLSLDVQYVELPKATWDTFRFLKKYLYVSLGEAQHQSWSDYSHRPLTSQIPFDPLDSNLTDFYQESLTSKDFTVSLLKILLLLLSSSRYESTSDHPIDIVKEVKNISKDSNYAFTHNDDLTRYKEITLKNLCHIFVLLLKHLKANHIYQYTAFVEHLNASKCTTIMSYAFKLNLVNFISDTVDYPEYDFPWAFFTPDSAQLAKYSTCDQKSVSRRNISIVVSFLRIFEKLIRRNPSQIEKFVELGGVKFAQKALDLRFALTQIYASKILKCVYYIFGERIFRENLPLINVMCKCVLLPYYETGLFAASDDKALLERRKRYKKQYEALIQSITSVTQVYNSSLKSDKLNYDPTTNEFWLKNNLSRWTTEILQTSQCSKEEFLAYAQKIPLLNKYL